MFLFSRFIYGKCSVSFSLSWFIFFSSVPGRTCCFMSLTSAQWNMRRLNVLSNYWIIGLFHCYKQQLIQRETWHCCALHCRRICEALIYRFIGYKTKCSSVFVSFVRTRRRLFFCVAFFSPFAALWYFLLSRLPSSLPVTSVDIMGSDFKLE